MIKQAAVHALAKPFIWKLMLRRAHRRCPLTIVCYHTLGPDRGGINCWTVVKQSAFREQLREFLSVYDIVSLDDALTGKQGERPQLVITFDDGDCGLWEHLVPLLSSMRVPATVYVTTSQIEDGCALWFDRVVNAHQDAGKISVAGFGQWELPRGTDKAHWAVLSEVLEALKNVDPSHRDELADAVAAQGTPQRGAGLGPMTRNQLCALADMPGVTIGAHSHGHELLDQLSPKAAKASIARSRTLLQDWTRQPVRHFAYPNGNETLALREIVRELGFVSAVGLEERVAPQGSDVFAIPRISIGRYDNLARVRLRLAGI